MTINTKSLKNCYLFFSLLPLFIFTSSSVIASGMDNLSNTLMSFSSQQPIQAKLTIESHREREGRENNDGLIQLHLSENQQGFNVHYPKEILALLEAEAVNQNATKSNEYINSPTTFAMKNLKQIQLRNMVSVSTSLQRFIQQLNFDNESTVTYQGEEATLLTFTMNLETIVTEKKDRKNVKKFKGSYQLWTTPSGIPLEAQMTYNGSGSYLFVFKTKREHSITEKFKVINNRLIVSEYSSVFNSNSTFGKFFETNNKTLTVL